MPTGTRTHEVSKGSLGECTYGSFNSSHRIDNKKQKFVWNTESLRGSVIKDVERYLSSIDSYPLRIRHWGKSYIIDILPLRSR